MDWKNTFEKAGTLSKLAYTALKNAQQKIDAALDIEIDSDPLCSVAPLLKMSSEESRLAFEVPDANHSSITACAPFSSGRATPSHSNLVDRDVKECTDGSAPEGGCSSVSETSPKIPSVHLALRPEVLSLSETSLSTSPKGNPVSLTSPSNESASIVTQESVHFERSCSETDLTSLQMCKPGGITHQKATAAGTEMDLETYTTGSDIEVISGGNSTNGESLHLSHQASHSQYPLTQLKETENFDAPLGSHKFASYFNCESFEAGFLGSSVGRHTQFPVSEMSCRKHRRAISQEFRYGHSIPNEEDSSFAFHWLSKNYAEKKKLLSIREAKILDLNKENAELRELISLLESQLGSGNSPQDLSSLSMEFSQRLSKTELQLRMVSRERDQLKASLANAQSRSLLNTGGSSSSTNVDSHLRRIAELERLLAEKTAQHDDLFKEGEKLSQQLFRANNLIKKLRANEKDAEQREKVQAEKVATMNVQLQRLQCGLKAKEDSIKEQANKVTHLKQLSQTQEKELEHLKVQLLHSKSKLKDSLDEVEQLKRKLAALEAELHHAQLVAESTTQSTENEHALREECRILKLELGSVKSEFASFRLNHEQQAQHWRDDRDYFQHLLAESNSRAESMGDAATSAAQPAMLQLLELQATMQRQTAMWEQTELNLTQRLVEAQRQSQLAIDSDRTHYEQLKTAESRVCELEHSLTDLRTKYLSMLQECHEHKDSIDRYRNTEHELHVQVETLTERNKSLESRLSQLELDLSSAGKEFKPLTCTNQRSLTDHSVQTRSEPPILPLVTHDPTNAQSEQISKTPDPVVDRVPTSQFVNFTSETALEYLQSLLKLKDGECGQLRRDIECLSRTKETLLSEIASLSSRSEQLARLAGLHDDHSASDAQHDEMEELQRRYDSLLLIYGRVIEENNELRLDLADMKAMYRAQMDMLFRDS